MRLPIIIAVTGAFAASSGSFAWSQTYSDAGFYRGNTEPQSGEGRASALRYSSRISPAGETPTPTGPAAAAGLAPSVNAPSANTLSAATGLPSSPWGLNDSGFAATPQNGGPAATAYNRGPMTLAAQPTAVPGIKNYYSSLFLEPQMQADPRLVNVQPTATTRPAATTNATNVTETTATMAADAAAGEPMSAGGQQRNLYGPPSGVNHLPTDNPTVSNIQPASHEEAYEPNPHSQLRHANYDRHPSTPAGGTIQQVAGAEPAPSGPTFGPPIDNPFAAAARQSTTFGPAAPQSGAASQNNSASQSSPASQRSVAETANNGPAISGSAMTDPAMTDPAMTGPTIGPTITGPSMTGPTITGSSTNDATPAQTSNLTVLPNLNVATNSGNASDPNAAAGPRMTEAKPVPAAANRSETADGTPTVKPLIDVLSSPETVSGTPRVEARWIRKGEVNVGRECVCELEVTNSGQGPAAEVSIDAVFPRSVRLISAEPQPQVTNDRLTWSFAALPVGSKEKITINLIPSEPGDLQVSAYVRFSQAVATSLTVREPMLELQLNGPTQVAALGEAASQTVTISNPGSGIAENVVVEAVLPAGLEHARGDKLIQNIGMLAAGESRQVQLVLVATGSGPQPIQVRATAAGGLTRSSLSTLVVAAPSLKVAADGPGLRYIGRDATYRIEVTNNGAAPSNNVRLTHTVPDGFTFLKADHGGRHDANAKQVAWFLGRLEAGQTVTVNVDLAAAKLGEFEHKITAFGDSGTKAEANVATKIDGVASLVVEILDLDDPVEVGSETAYEVRVRNEGTKAARHLDIACKLPPGVTVVAAQGPTDQKTNAGAILFAPIEELEPGKAALFRVIVKGTAPGNHRFQVRLLSEGVTEPLVYEEITKFYAD